MPTQYRSQLSKDLYFEQAISVDYGREDFNAAVTNISMVQGVVAAGYFGPLFFLKKYEMSCFFSAEHNVKQCYNFP